MDAEVEANTIHTETAEVKEIASENDVTTTTSRSRLLEVFLVASEFSQSTSINGILFIKKSCSVTAKLFWALLFLAAVGALVFHSYWSISDYLSYKTKTTVNRTLQEKMQLPFVTFCNKNPIRLSQVVNTSPEIKAIIYSSSFEYYVEHYGRKSIVNGSDYVEDDENTTSLSSDNTENSTDDSLNQLGYQLERLKKAKRREIGHQINDMLIACYNDIVDCGSGNFKLFSSTYGNCYTLDTTGFEQHEEGVFGGWPESPLPGSTSQMNMLQLTMIEL